MTAGTRTRTTSDRSARPPAGARRERAGGRGQGVLRLPAWLDGPLTSSHLILGAGGLLLAIGLVMVFSASSIEAAKAGLPAWAPGVKQLGLDRGFLEAHACWPPQILSIVAKRCLCIFI